MSVCLAKAGRSQLLLCRQPRKPLAAEGRLGGAAGGGTEMSLGQVNPPIHTGGLGK